MLNKHASGVLLFLPGGSEPVGSGRQPFRESLKQKIAFEAGWGDDVGSAIVRMKRPSEIGWEHDHSAAFTVSDTGEERVEFGNR